jgi:hypothetical protein
LITLLEVNLSIPESDSYDYTIHACRGFMRHLDPIRLVKELREVSAALDADIFAALASKINAAAWWCQDGLAIFVANAN